MDSFELDVIDQINLKIYEEIDVENLSNVEALKKYSKSFGKTALYLINKNEFDKSGILSIFFIAHLSIELYLKSLISQQKIPTSHDLKKILSLIPSNISLSEEIKSKILDINNIGKNGFGFRYPIDKKGKKYENFEVEIFPELNCSETYKNNKMIITKGIKQSPVKNYLKMIDDIKILIEELILIEK